MFPKQSDVVIDKFQEFKVTTNYFLAKEPISTWLFVYFVDIELNSCQSILCNGLKPVVNTKQINKVNSKSTF